RWLWKITAIFKNEIVASILRPYQAPKPRAHILVRLGCIEGPLQEQLGLVGKAATMDSRALFDLLLQTRRYIADQQVGHAQLPLILRVSKSGGCLAGAWCSNIRSSPRCSGRIRLNSSVPSFRSCGGCCKACSSKYLASSDKLRPCLRARCCRSR